MGCLKSDGGEMPNACQEWKGKLQGKGEHAFQGVRVFVEASIITEGFLEVSSNTTSRSRRYPNPYTIGRDHVWPNRGNPESHYCNCIEAAAQWEFLCPHIGKLYENFFGETVTTARCVR